MLYDLICFWETRVFFIHLILFSELICYTYSYLHGDLEGTKKQQFLEWLFWSVCFGPVLYPISLIVWHLVQICKGENNFHR